MVDKKLLQSLPQVGEAVNLVDADVVSKYGHDQVVDSMRIAIDSVRQAVLSGEAVDASSADAKNVVGLALKILENTQEERQVPVINATGVILHTSLGRAVLSKKAWEFASRVADGYSLLELRRESGKRGDRDVLVNDLVVSLTGADAATVVNNNAAATMLILNELADGKEIIISRAHQVEIGGSYRMPDVMAKSGGLMIEVGTTNKCYVEDYANAINENTGCLLKVHTSNYDIQGFTHYASLEELVALGRERNIPVVYDLGAGSLVDLEPFGLKDEPVVADLLKAGADLVCFSGDKLFGGPQAGICVGRADLIARLKKNQLFRMLRCDKVTLALLEATLRQYHTPELLWEEIPTLHMISEPLEAVTKRANQLCESLKDVDAELEVVEHESFVGGGSLPTKKVPSAALALKPKSDNLEALGRALRMGEPCVFGRASKERLLFDCRTVREDQIPLLAKAIRAALADQG